MRRLHFGFTPLYLTSLFATSGAVPMSTRTPIHPTELPPFALVPLLSNAFPAPPTTVTAPTTTVTSTSPPSSKSLGRFGQIVSTAANSVVGQGELPTKSSLRQNSRCKSGLRLRGRLRRQSARLRLNNNSSQQHATRASYSYCKQRQNFSKLTSTFRTHFKSIRPLMSSIPSISVQRIRSRTRAHSRAYTQGD